MGVVEGICAAGELLTVDLTSKEYMRYSLYLSFRLPVGKFVQCLDLEDSTLLVPDRKDSSYLRPGVDHHRQHIWAHQLYNQ